MKGGNGKTESHTSKNAKYSLLLQEVHPSILQICQHICTMFIIIIKKIYLHFSSFKYKIAKVQKHFCLQQYTSKSWQDQS